jgi:hypothetical protein
LCQRRTLTKDHPICRFLQPFLFNTAAINHGAKLTLIPIGSLAHRLSGNFLTITIIMIEMLLIFVFLIVITRSGLSKEVFEKAFSDTYDSWIFETFPESIRRKHLDEVPPEVFPWALEGCALWDSISDFCNKFIRLYYPTEMDFKHDDCARDFCNSMNEMLSAPESIKTQAPSREHCAKLLTMHVWWVSGGHTYAGGQLALYLQTPYLVPPNMKKWNKGDKTSAWTDLLPPQRMIMTAWTLVAMTQGTNPMLRQDFGHLFSGMPKEAEAKALIADFTGPHLGEVVRLLEMRNELRQWQLSMFDPDLLASSVSV